MAKREGKTDYECETQQNLMKIMRYLKVDILMPKTEQELKLALNMTKNQVHWTLHNLKIGGWAEQVAGGWRITPEFSRMAEDIRVSFAETVKRYLG